MRVFADIRPRIITYRRGSCKENRFRRRAYNIIINYNIVADDDNNIIWFALLPAHTVLMYLPTYIPRAMRKTAKRDIIIVGSADFSCVFKRKKIYVNYTPRTHLHETNSHAQFPISPCRDVENLEILKFCTSHRYSINHIVIKS